MLQTIDDTVPICRAEPDDLDALTTIRRGFHTLKGSGRMVGLMDLGEVAWEIERVMNQLAGGEEPATPAAARPDHHRQQVVRATGSARCATGGLKGEVDGNPPGRHGRSS